MLTKIFLLLSLFALAILCMLFGAENRETISLTMFDFETWELPVWAWMIVSLGFGLLIGYALAILGKVGSAKENK